MSRLRRIGLVLLVLAVVVVAWEPTRVGLQTAALLPNLLGAGFRPLSLFSEAPHRSAVEYRPGPDGGAPELAELWLPSWATPDRKAGAILLVLGVNNVGRNQRRGPGCRRPGADRHGGARPGLARPARGPARGRRGRRRRARLRDSSRAAPRWIQQRVGIAGFSVGGSLALLAAADARIADGVRFVNAFGAFGDAATLPRVRLSACLSRWRR